MTVQPGEIWLADIPFTDASASKVRSVLILWLERDRHGRRCCNASSSK